MENLTARYPKFILAGILVLAFLLRFHNIGEHGLAGDEKYSLFVSQFVSYEGNNQRNSVRKPDNPYFTPEEFWSKKGINDFFDSIARLDTGNGALYTFTLHHWTSLFGLEDQNLRLLSLVFNLLTIILLYVFVKTHFQSTNLALLTTFLAANSPFYINYSQIARTYAMLFFFALLATHLFLIIINKEKKKEKPLNYYIYYGLAALACELCHLSTFPLFLIHGLYVLLYVRTLRVWIGLILAMLIPLSGILLWLNSNGGHWLFEYVQNSVKVYNYLAKTSPDTYLTIATFPNVLKQLQHVVSSSFITAEGLYLYLAGLKNILIAITISIISFSSIKWIKSERIKIVIVSLLYIASFFLYSVAKLQFIIFSLNIVLVFMLIDYIRRSASTKTFPLLTFLLLLVILPFIFLILFAFQDGNTFRIIPRYIGYSYAFGILLIALLIREIWRLKSSVKLVLFILLGIQFFLLSGIIKTIWKDNPPRYFMTYSEPRKANPYTTSAKLIQSQYAKGDTVIYCAHKDTMPGGVDTPTFSVVDAQLTNFYLPKNSNIIQRVNPKEPDKIILKKADGREVVIFDFEGTRYRY